MSPTCRHIEPILVAFVAGDLPPAQADEVRRHLESCESCQGVRKELEPTLSRLQAALAAPLDAPVRLDDAHRRRVFHAIHPSPSLAPAEPRLAERVRRIVEGVFAPSRSGAHKYAVYALQRAFVPALVALVLSVTAAFFFLSSPQMARREIAAPAIDVTVVELETAELEELKELDLSYKSGAEVVQAVPPSADVGIVEPDTPPELVKSPLVIRGLYAGRAGGGAAKDKEPTHKREGADSNRRDVDGDRLGDDWSTLAPGGAKDNLSGRASARSLAGSGLASDGRIVHHSTADRPAEGPASAETPVPAEESGRYGLTVVAGKPMPSVSAPAPLPAAQPAPPPVPASPTPEDTAGARKLAKATAAPASGQPSLALTTPARQPSNVELREKQMAPSVTTRSRKKAQAERDEYAVANEPLPVAVDSIAPPAQSPKAASKSDLSSDAKASGQASESVDIGEFDMMETTSPLVFRGLYTGRSTSGREDSLVRYGGGMGDRTEDGVLRSLRWLKGNQADDGSWGRVEDTSAGLLALLAHGETTASDEFGESERRALRSLLRAQRKDGRLSDDSDENAKAALALGEAYALTAMPVLRMAAEDAMATVIRDISDGKSVSGWHVQALRSAKSANLGLNELPQAIEKAAGTLAQSGDPAVAAYAYSQTGQLLTEQGRTVVNQLGDTPVRIGDKRPIDLMYFAHQAKFNQGGKPWVQHNRSFVPELMAAQSADGSWTNLGDDKSIAYQTAMGAMMGEVYYRFLPTYMPVEPEPDPADAEEDILIRFDNRAEAEPETTEVGIFRAWGVNPFVETGTNRFSTFSIDVDTASYTLARNYMMNGKLPPAEAVRTEEFVNFFDYGYRGDGDRPFTLHAECAPSPFGRGLHLLKVGVKARTPGRDQDRRAVLTFLVDTSGSMSTPDRIGLIRQSLALLVEQLDPEDRVAIIQYESHARLVLDFTPASDKARILQAVAALQPSGSTNLEEGMRLAYETAARGFVPGAANRVLLLSDGAANLGSTAASEILARVDGFRRQGIFCSVYGFGIGTYNDETLEALANKGDGTYAFVDSLAEARRLFVDQLAAALHVVAADVKIQVEFTPARVTRFRQLGYENRALREEDFRNDAVDAGEVGSGQSVTALYELELAPRAAGLLGTVRIRYRNVDTGAVEEYALPLGSSIERPRFEDASTAFRLSACAAAFAEILRGSPFAGDTSYADVAQVLRPVALELSLDTRVQELLRMVQLAGSLPRATSADAGANPLP